MKVETLKNPVLDDPVADAERMADEILAAELPPKPPPRRDPYLAHHEFTGYAGICIRCGKEHVYCASRLTPCRRDDADV